MKHLLAICVITLISHLSFSQSYYQVKTLGTNYSLTQIDQAFASADFCGSHMLSERRELSFDDGTVVELLGSTELASIAPTCAQPDDFIFAKATWSISGTHLIMAQDSGQNLSEKEKLSLKRSKQ